eukprot:342956-Chlamydomonas_euryale.AAC.4
MNGRGAGSMVCGAEGVKGPGAGRMASGFRRSCLRSPVPRHSTFKKGQPPTHSKSVVCTRKTKTGVVDAFQAAVAGLQRRSRTLPVHLALAHT